MNQDPIKQILCGQSDRILQQTCFKRQRQVKNTTKAPEQVLQRFRKKKTWPRNKKRKNDMKLGYF